MNTILKNIANATQTPDYSAEAVNGLIKRLKLNEKAFAIIMNVSLMTVKLWTSGAVKPCNPGRLGEQRSVLCSVTSLSRRLMQIYEICPEAAEKLANGSDSD